MVFWKFNGHRNAQFEFHQDFSISHALLHIPSVHRNITSPIHVSSGRLAPCTPSHLVPAAGEPPPHLTAPRYQELIAWSALFTAGWCGVPGFTSLRPTLSVRPVPASRGCWHRELAVLLWSFPRQLSRPQCREFRTWHTEWVVCRVFRMPSCAVSRVT